MILTITFFLIIFVFFVVYFLKHKAYRIFALCCFPLLIGKRALLVRRVAHDCRRRGYPSRSCKTASARSFLTAARRI